jgi:hypothetical protein
LTGLQNSSKITEPLGRLIAQACPVQRRREAFMKKVNRPSALDLSRDNIADQMVENDPAFKARIEKAFAEYKTSGGISAASLIRKFQKFQRKTDSK